MHHRDADRTYREKARREQHKNYTSYIGPILEATPHETTAVRPLLSLQPSNMANKTCGTLLEKQGRTEKCWLANKNLPANALYSHHM